MSYYCPVCRCHERGGAGVGPGSEKVEGAGLGLLEQPGISEILSRPAITSEDDVVAARSVHPFERIGGNRLRRRCRRGAQHPAGGAPAASCGSCHTVHRPQAESDWLTSHLQLLPDAVRKTHTPGVPRHRGGDRTPRRCPPSDGASSFSGVPAALPRSGRRPLLETGHRLRLGSRGGDGIRQARTERRRHESSGAASGPPGNSTRESLSSCTRRAQLPEREELRLLEEETAILDERLEVAGSHHHDLERLQKRYDDDLSAVLAKREQERGLLYSGQVTAMRELQSLEEEVAALGRRQRVVEDKLLEVMEQLEPSTADLEDLRSRREELGAADRQDAGAAGRSGRRDRRGVRAGADRTCRLGGRYCP